MVVSVRRSFTCCLSLDSTHGSAMKKWGKRQISYEWIHESNPRWKPGNHAENLAVFHFEIYVSPFVKTPNHDISDCHPTAHVFFSQCLWVNKADLWLVGSLAARRFRRFHPDPSYPRPEIKIFGVPKSVMSQWFRLRLRLGFQLWPELSFERSPLIGNRDALVFTELQQSKVYGRPW